jgi:DNA-binding transcriptional LysR family regulator
VKGKHFITEVRVREPAGVMLAEPVAFDAASCARTLRIGGPDYEIALFGAHLIALCGQFAPDMRLVLRAVTPKQALKDLVEGDIDLALGHFSVLPKVVSSTALCEEHYRVAARKDHAGVGDALSLDDYLAHDHILVSAGGGTTEIVDEILAQQGKKRRVVAAVPIFLSALAAVASTDAIVTMPAHLIAHYAGYFHLRTYESPVAIPPFNIMAVWRRGAHDPAVQWLVEQIKSELRSA